MTVATLVKTIGASADFSTVQLWEDGAPVDLTTAEKWNAGTFVGTFTQGETVTGTGLTAGKFLDSNGSSYVAFGIVTGNSATLVTLTGSASGATCIVSAKTDTGIIWQGQMKNAALTVTAVTTIGGSTTSSTCYKELTAQAGASFRDSASFKAGRLYADVSGAWAAISSSTGYINMITCTDISFRMSNIMLKNTAVGGVAISAAVSSSTIIFDNLIVYYKTNGTAKVVSIYSTGSKIRNSLIIYDNTAAGVSMLSASNGATAYNCTLVSLSVKVTDAFQCAYVGGAYQNLAFFNATNARTGGVSPTFTTCYTDVASPPAGCTTVAFDTSTGSGFTNITSGSEDLRLKSTSALLDVGTTDATNAATDIVGTARPSGSAYDVGAWEYVAAALAPFIPTPSLRVPLIAALSVQATFNLLISTLAPAVSAPFIPGPALSVPMARANVSWVVPNLLVSTLTSAAAPPFSNPPALPVPSWAPLGQFVSLGVPDTLTLIVPAPFSNPFVPAPQSVWTQNPDTSHGSPLTLLAPSVPPPPFFNPPQFVPQPLTPVYSSGALVPNLLTSTLGAATTLSIVQPYITVYFWKRTA